MYVSQKTHTETGDRPVREVRDLSTGDSEVGLTQVVWSTVISQIHLCSIYTNHVENKLVCCAKCAAFVLYILSALK